MQSNIFYNRSSQFCYQKWMDMPVVRKNTADFIQYINTANLGVRSLNLFGRTNLLSQMSDREARQAALLRWRFLRFLREIADEARRIGVCVF